MNEHIVEYRVVSCQGDVQSLRLTFDAASFVPILTRTEAPPAWTVLDFCQCPHCPLTVPASTHCPLALNLAPLVVRFGDLVSCDDVRLEVDVDGKRISADTTAQRALSALMGLMIAASDCPHTTFLRPMARFHVPLAGRAETVFRASATYLLGQFLRQRAGLSSQFSLDGLADRYRQLERLNASVAQRLRAASHADASVNAIILLDTYAKALPMVIATDLEEIRPLFAPYLHP